MDYGTVSLSRHVHVTIGRWLVAVVQTRIDDISGEHDAVQRRLIVDEGKWSTVLEIDLADHNMLRMLEKVQAAMSAYMRVGSVSRVKTTDLMASPAVVEASTAEPVRTELPPEGETAKAIAKRASAKRKPSKALRTAPPVRQAVNAAGEPYSPYYLGRTTRPGIRTWWERNWEVLQLREFKVGGNGRMPKEVEAAWDRYQGQEVTIDTLHQDDMDRLDLATAPKKNPTPLDMSKKE